MCVCVCVQPPSTALGQVEEGEGRHLMAPNMITATKLRKRMPHAKKLHIFNDHTFIATHFKEYVL